ncbi:MAG: hypothetical protein MMC33_005925 [Icmadophila ericetorum]|nr:hypothetical protein [Icmadophila ericetorum]
MSYDDAFPPLPGPGFQIVRPPKRNAIPIRDPKSNPVPNGKEAKSSRNKRLSETTSTLKTKETLQPVKLPFSQLTAATVVSVDHRKHLGTFNGTWNANVYAAQFIPEALSAVNHSYATVIKSACLTNIDYADYISRFAGKKYLTPLACLAPITSTNRIINSSLTGENYKAYFDTALTAEIQAHTSSISTYNLYKVPLAFKSIQQHLFELHVPGMREDRPQVDLGGTIMLRQLRIDRQTDLPIGMDLWLQPGGGKDRGYPAPGFTGFQYNASVWGLQRAKELVILRVDGLLAESMVFNCAFQVQLQWFDKFARAVNDIGQQIYHDGSEGEDEALEMSTTEGDIEVRNGQLSNGDKNETAKSWMTQMLFPKKSDGVKQKGLPQGVFEQEFFDNMLNYEQQKAVDTIQKQNYGDIPFLISGPPGTGKTKTIVEAALQLAYHTSPVRKHILLCAPSDPAADILALRVKAHVPFQDLFRLNAPTRSFAEVPAALLPHCYTVNDLFSIPDFDLLMSFKIVVTTCRDADLLVQARVTNRDVCKLERGMTAAVHYGGKLDGFKTALHWDALLIDEAAQATEPEAGIPLTVVAPPDHGSFGKVIFVMAGDQFQLGPRVYSRQIALEMSLFERLFDRPVYRDHPLARRSLKRNSLTNQPREEMIRPPFANLIRNYRSHPAILSIPSALFYNDTLVAEAIDTDRVEGWIGWKGRGWPVLFAENTGGDVRELEGYGWYNISEAKKACDFAKSLAGHISQSDICIMSPFRGQVKILRDIIRRLPYELHNVNIGPTEAYQGLEHQFVIICTTRTQSRYLLEDHAGGLGIINEPKRFNVAMTRAKSGLIVIGNPEILCKDNSWNAFGKFCWRHGLWKGFEESEEQEGSEKSEESPNSTNASPPKKKHVWDSSDEPTPSYISSLETGMIYAEEQPIREGQRQRLRKLRGSNNQSLMTTQDEEDAMWTSGIAAELALREE